MTSPIISLKNVSKRYSRTEAGQRGLRRKDILRDLTGIRRKKRPVLGPHEFWALDDVSLDIRHGEAVGVIGRNGAGKSTLMKMIGGVLTPDFGTASLETRVSKLISLSAEFQPNLTGRENVFLVGAVRGLPYGVIAQQLDDIVTFAELENFIDAPFHTYSQGMRLRLAFSVAVHAPSPVMLIDEVLAVGDVNFQQKCLRRLTELKNKSTYVIVSHSMGYISQFCERTLVVSDGAIVFDGPTRDALAFAEKMNEVDDTSAIKVGSAGEMRLGRVHNKEAISRVETNWLNNEGTPIKTVSLGAPLHFEVKVTLERALLEMFNVHVQIGGMEANSLVSFSNRSSGVTIQPPVGEETRIIATLAGVSLAVGRHGCAISIFDGAELIYRSDLPPLIVDGRGHKIWGEVQFKPNWQVNAVKASRPQSEAPTDFESSI